MTAPHTPAIIGHRGARGLYPENTIGGFRAAIALGVAAFELDVAVTADDVAVVHHDPALNPDIARASGGWIAAPGPLIRTLSAAALAGYDVGRLRPGAATAAHFPDQRPEDGARIPTLADVLRLPARFTIEMKTFPTRPEATVPPARMLALVLDAVAAAGAGDRVILSSFDWRGLHAARRRAPTLPLSFLTGAGAPAATWWAMPDADPAAPAAAIARAGGAIWSPEQGRVVADDVDAARRAGLRIVPWTANRPEDIARLAALGVDALITDRPDIAMATLATPVPAAPVPPT